MISVCREKASTSLDDIVDRLNEELVESRKRTEDLKIKLHRAKLLKKMRKIKKECSRAKIIYWMYHDFFGEAIEPCENLYRAVKEISKTYGVCEVEAVI